MWQREHPLQRDEEANPFLILSLLHYSFLSSLLSSDPSLELIIICNLLPLQFTRVSSSLYFFIVNLIPFSSLSVLNFLSSSFPTSPSFPGDSPGISTHSRNILTKRTKSSSSTSLFVRCEEDEEGKRRWVNCILFFFSCFTSVFLPHVFLFFPFIFLLLHPDHSSSCLEGQFFCPMQTFTRFPIFVSLPRFLCLSINTRENATSWRERNERERETNLRITINGNVRKDKNKREERTKEKDSWEGVCRRRFRQQGSFSNSEPRSLTVNPFFSSSSVSFISWHQERQQKYILQSKRKTEYTINEREIMVRCFG